MSVYDVFFYFMHVTPKVFITPDRNLNYMNILCMEYVVLVHRTSLPHLYTVPRTVVPSYVILVHRAFNVVFLHRSKTSPPHMLCTWYLACSALRARLASRADAVTEKAYRTLSCCSPTETPTIPSSPSPQRSGQRPTEYTSSLLVSDVMCFQLALKRAQDSNETARHWCVWI